MLRARLVALLAAQAGLVAWPAAARGGDLEISPVVVDLGRARSTLVTLKNVAAERGRYQVRVFSWGESALGESRLEPASDLVAFPTVLELAPGEERKLRIGTTATPGEREQTWRVFVEEILPAVTAEEGRRLRTRLRVGIPVFFAPQRPLAGAEIVGLGVEKGRVTFLLRNSGTIRIRPSSVRVALADAKGATVFEKTLSGWYVLAGSDRLFDLDLPRASCLKANTVIATAATDQPIESRRPVPDGACGP